MVCCGVVSKVVKSVFISVILFVLLWGIFYYCTTRYFFTKCGLSGDLLCAGC